MFKDIGQYDNKFEFADFKEFVEVVSKSGDTIISEECSSENDLVKIICPKGSSMHLTPREYYHGRRCKQCVKNTHGKHIAKINLREKENFFRSKGYIIKKVGYKFDLKCPRGHDCKIPYSDFKNSGRRCNKCGRSSGETAIGDYLYRKGIGVIIGYTFDDCCDKGVLEFDFALIRGNIPIAIIEYDGECHYRIKTIYGGYDCLLEHQRRDKIKTNYCQSKDIPLLRIPYWQIENIDEILDRWLKDKNW